MFVPLTKYTPLEDAALKTLAQNEFAKERYEWGIQPVPNPVYVAIAGQPGAGKTAASELIVSELDSEGRALHLDVDVQRENLPTGDLKPNAAETQRDAGRLVDELRSLATEHQINIVEEGTFRDPVWTSSLIDQQKQAGYEAHMIAVATPPELSLASVYKRHEIEHNENVFNPRLVPDAYHASALDGFKRTVAETANEFKSVRVVNRNGDLLYDSTRTDQKGSAIDAINRAHRPTDKQLKEVSDTWQYALENSATRTVNPNYTEAIKTHMADIEDQKKQRIHEHALESVNVHLGALNKDHRFSQHTQEELMKVAYFRGVHEKANEFKGLPPNFAAYDTTMSDRNIVKIHLPTKVEGLNLPAPTQEKSAKTKDDGLSL